MAERLPRLLDRLGVAAVAGFFVALLWLWCASLRKRTRQLERLDRYVAEGHEVVAVFWHGKYLPLFPLARGRRVAVITVNSFRGRVIAAICRAFGYRPVLLPADANAHGFPALAQQARLHQGLMALALDGPTGPYHRIRSGALQLSAHHGVKLAPVEVASSRKLVFASRWDRREAPLPFSRVAIAVGPLIDLASIKEAERMEAIVRQCMEAVRREAESLLD